MKGLPGYIGKISTHSEPTLIGAFLIAQERNRKAKSRRYKLKYSRSPFTFARRRRLVNRLRNVYHLPIQHIARITGFSLRTISKDIISIGKRLFHASRLGFKRSKKLWGKLAIINRKGLKVTLDKLCRLAFLYINGELAAVEQATGDEPP